MSLFSFSVAVNNTVSCIYLQVDFNSRNTLTAERQTFYCVPIPGENPWVKDISSSRHPCMMEVLLKQETEKFTFYRVIFEAGIVLSFPSFP